jgi:hypothetical protein
MFKYAGEQDDRYLVATDLSWRTLDIVQTYTLRWLVEGFTEDLKSYEGWAQLAKQTGEEGSSRGLSLLLDLCLLLHPEQLARIENKLPACNVTPNSDGGFIGWCAAVIQSPDPAEQLAQLGIAVKAFFRLRPSGKRMSSRDLSRLEPTPTLKHRAVA